MAFQSAAASWTRRNTRSPDTSRRASRFQSAAASWTRRNGAASAARSPQWLFQSAAASWTRRNRAFAARAAASCCFNPPPRRGRGGMRRVTPRRPTRSCFNPPPRRGRGGMPSVLSRAAAIGVSIRRRVVDAAECRSAAGREDALLFQSAAASWTRRNTYSQAGKGVYRSFNPPPRRGRGGMINRAKSTLPLLCFNPPPRRGRGGMGGCDRPARPRRVSIRRRVVDAAEFRASPAVSAYS